MSTLATAQATAAAPGADESVAAEVGRIAPVEGLRGVAVLWVILFHCFTLRPDDPWTLAIKSSPFAPFIANGYLGVDLFFLISGFLLAMPWFVHAQSGRTPPSMRAFYVRRFWRIAPAYYVQLALLFAVALPLLRGVAFWRSDLYVYIYNLVVHGLFLHNTTPLSSGSMAVNGALWTLSVEAQFYVLLPLAMPLFVRWPRASLIASLALAALWRIGARDDLAWLVQAEMAFGKIWSWPESVVRYLLEHQLPSYLGHFGLGIVMGHAWLVSRHVRAPAWVFDTALAAGAMLLYWTLAIDGRLIGDASWALPMFSLAALLYWAAARPGTFTQSILGRGPLALAGRVSYSAYLYHLPLLILCNEYLAAWPAAIVIPAYLAGTFVAAWLSWRYVEQRFIHGIASPRRAPSR